MEINYCPQCGKSLRSAEIGGRTRRCCSGAGCSYVFWNNPIPVVAAIVTGFLEQDETPDDAVRREVREELGLEATAAHFLGNYTFFEMNQLLLAYHVTAWGDIILGDELADIKRVPVERLKPWTIGTGPAVRDWLALRRHQGDPYS